MAPGLLIPAVMNDRTASFPGQAQGAPFEATILGVVGLPADAVTYQRFEQPFAHLGERGLRLRTLGTGLKLCQGPQGLSPAPELFDGVDAVVFPQLVASPLLPDGRRVEVIELMCAAARARGIPVIYSTDDWLPEISAVNPGSDRVLPALSGLDRLREQAVAVIVTTPPLAEAVAPWGKPVHVIPNSVDPARWTQRPRASGRVPRIGWVGSASHLDDVLLIVKALKELSRRVEFQFVLQGLTDLPLATQLHEIERQRRRFNAVQRERAERFVEIARHLKDLRAEHRPFGPHAAWFADLPALDLDIGLCPLLATPFNRHKSALKFYEYAVTGSVTLASDVTPYREEVSLLCANEPAAWCEAIERLLKDRVLRERELALQREFVLNERTIGRWQDRWAAIWHTILEPSHVHAT